MKGENHEDFLAQDFKDNILTSFLPQQARIYQASWWRHRHCGAG